LSKFLKDTSQLRIQRLVRCVIVGFILCHLNACAWVGVTPSNRSETDRQILYRLGVWQFQGRLVVKTHKDSWHANIDWSHTFGLDTLQFSGPFGQGATRILVYPDSIRIIDSKGNIDISENSQRTIYRRFGFQVPLSSLKFWVLGVTEPDVKNCIENDADGFLRKIWYQDWEVFIKKYMVSDKYTVPKLIQIKNKDTVLKLVIDHWSQGVE